jgi:hypothetical protein
MGEAIGSLATTVDHVGCSTTHFRTVGGQPGNVLAFFHPGFGDEFADSEDTPCPPNPAQIISVFIIPLLRLCHEAAKFEERKHVFSCPIA